MKRWKPISIVSLVILVALIVTSTLYNEGNPVQADTGGSEDTVIVRVYYPNMDMARKVFVSFEGAMLETNYEEGYHIMEVTQEQIALLTDVGLRVEVDEQYTFSTLSIPSYPCYRTVEETFDDAQAIANNYPNLATLIDAGNSWEKTAGIGGYDMLVLRLTNSAISGDKPKLFLTGAIHAREYTTAELGLRFLEYLVQNYGPDPDATWILDHHEVHVMLHTNPDGRKQAETGLSWRKNTNQNYCGATSNNRGADLNRNFEYNWGCCGGSSGSECNSTYRGPSPVSEPETQAAQNYMQAIFPDQRGSGSSAAAPDDATGVYIDLHSYSELVLWPWGYTSSSAPNGTQMQTLGRKFAYWNGYTPEQAIGLYPTDGTTDDFVYGDLGVASFTFELGTAFFQNCTTFNNTIVPDNMPALIYAAKVSRTPYMTSYGPDAYSLSLSQDNVPAGTNVTLSATVNDTRYNNSNGTEPTQNIAAAEYYVDVPPWESGSTAIAMSASDGSFNEKTEDVEATVDTTGWSEGKHIIFVRGEDADGNWGAFSAIFLNVMPPTTPTPTPTPAPPTPTPEPAAPILLVDDDAGKSYEGYFTAALDALGKDYDTWNVQSQGSPSTAELQQHDIVIWFTGDDYQTTLTSTDQNNLTAYLDGGGKLFITGQDIGYDINGSAFYGDYLHATYINDDTNTYGLTGYDILSGVNVNISGSGGANNQDYPSEIGLGSGGVGLFDYDGSYTWGGLRWEGAYKVVYLSFGYEAINTSADRESVMQKVLDWLEGVPPPPTPTPTNTPTPTSVPPTPTNTPTPTGVPPTPTPTGVPPTPTPTPEPGMVFFDDFESDLGWVANPSGSDTATTGQWERANPEGTEYSGVTYQLDTTASGSYDLVTGPLAGSSVGSYDIDGGVTSIRSLDIALPSSGDVTLSFKYYLAHYSNATSDDFLRVKVVGSTTSTVFEELGAGNVDGAAWETFSGSLNAFAGQTVYLLIEAADGGSGSLIEAAIDDVSITSSGPPQPTPTPTNTPVPTDTPTPTNTPTPGPTATNTPTPTNTPVPTDTPMPTDTPTPGPGPIFSDDFESALGWTTDPDGTDTATTGQWERADPESTSYGGLTYQLGTTASGSYDLVTEGSAGSSVGSYDIDNGDTTIRSPDIALPAGQSLTLSFSYYLAHYSNGSSDDYLRVKVVGSTSTTVFEELASGDYDEAAWADFNTSLDAFAGQTIYLLIEAADGGSGSLIEAAIDDVLIE